MKISELLEYKLIVESQASAVYAGSLPDVYKQLPKLGHGLTSIVLDKGDGNVLMFTRDAIKKEWLTASWGIKIGNTIDYLEGMPHKKMQIRDLPVFVVEMPKLYRLDANNKKILKGEMQKWEKCLALAGQKNKSHTSDNTIHDATNDFIEQYPDSILTPMFAFLQNYVGYANYDVAIRNTMQDVQGQMILVDPLVSKELLDIMYGQPKRNAFQRIGAGS